MKKLLIISPYFPPSNAADMQRVRTSLPYFNSFNWDVEVVVVDDLHSDTVKDDLLLRSVPPEIKIHKVGALNKKWTSKIGLGSIGLRSLPYYKRKVNTLLKNNKFDLIYFSTTQFPVCILGPYWKKKFKIPYVIDMQDPWRSDYYEDKPKAQRPPKYWFSYRLNKYLEPIAIKDADGLISVSENYIEDLKLRYPSIKTIPSTTITFGAFEPDIAVALANQDNFVSLFQPGFKNIAYAGRGGMDMYKAITPVFEALQKGLQSEPELFNKFKFYFIGTSYASTGRGVPTILPLAQQYGVAGNVVEITDRISYYHTLTTLQQADALYIPGSDDPKYTASKIFPYLLSKKATLAIFHNNSRVVNIFSDCAPNATVLTFDHDKLPDAEKIYKLLAEWAAGIFKPVALTDKFDVFNAKNMTKKQADLFDEVLKLNE